MKRDILLSFLSASLLILSFPNFNLWFFAWFGFVPLFLAIRNKPKLKVFFLYYLTGIIFWFGVIYWLVHVTFLGLIFLVLYLALYFGIFGFLVSLVTGYWLLVTIPAIWVLLEYLRSRLFTGFPWALLGYSQYLNLPIIQIVDITGVWGVSFLVMMVNVAIYSLGREKRTHLLLPILCLLITLTYGYYKLYRLPITDYRLPMKISVIQGNIPQGLKWSPQAKDFIMDKYLGLTKEAVKDKPDLIIWPEAALPVVLEEEPIFFERVKKLAKEMHTPLLLGAVTFRDNLYYNSAILVSGEDKILTQYDKLHLVPFGEYIPLRKIFGFLETVVPIGDFTRGKAYTVFKLPITNYQLPITFSSLICFEDLFPELSRQFVKKGANFLVNITNDAWFGRTSSPYQHLQASVFRAVENRVPLVRSANTGISGFIAPTGKIISLIHDKMGRHIFISGYQTQEIKFTKEHLTFYNRYGDIFIITCLFLALWGIILTFKNKV